MIYSVFKYFHPLKCLERKRKKWCVENASVELMNAIQANIPVLDKPLSEIDYIVLDLETTGFSPKYDDILSVGWIEINSMHIELSTAKHFYIKTNKDVNPKTAVVNHIVPEMLEEGTDLDNVLNAFFLSARGKVIIAHGCIMERTFIEQYFKKHYSIKILPLIWFDTLILEKIQIERLPCFEAIDLRLASVRKKYGLPNYSAHNALIDSIATAELYLAQISSLSNEIKVGNLYKMMN